MDLDTYKVILNVDTQFLDCENTGATNHRFTGEVCLNTRLYEVLYGLPCIRKSRIGLENHLVEWSPYSRTTRKGAKQIFEIVVNLPRKSLARPRGARSQALSSTRGCFLSSLRTPAPPTQQKKLLQREFSKQLH